MKRLSKPFQKRQAPDVGKTPEEIALPSDLARKIEMIRPYLIKNKDIITRRFVINGTESFAAVIYLDGITDVNILNRDILKPLMLNPKKQQMKDQGTENLIDNILQTALTVGQVKKVNLFSELVQSIFDGLTILLIDGYPEAAAVDIHGGEKRNIEEPDTEKALRGSREGFVENLVVNIALIRRKLRDPNLVAEKTMVGKRTRNDLAFLYIEDIADPKIVAEVKARVSKIEIDGILSTGYIDQLIEDNPYSFFPQIKGTERPDKVVAHLLEGKIAILVNGDPMALILPSTFVHFIQAPEDFYERTYIGSFSRLMRYFAFFLAVSLPGIYVALLSFQPELIPLDLVISLAEKRKLAPFPVAVEAFGLEIIIQLVIETGLRLPSSLGQTIGVVGGIILGQAAITANLASPAMVIVISATVIATFALPAPGIAQATRILRLPMLLLAASFGVVGLSLGWLALLAHLTSLESVGVPYFAPFAPTRFKDLKDSLIRTFIWKMRSRPESIPNINPRRQESKRKDK